MDNGIRKITLSVEDWHAMALDGMNTSVSVKLIGDSMRPLIRKQRDTVTVVPVYRPLKKGDIVLFRRDDGVYVVHRVRKIAGDTVLTIGDRCTEFDAWQNIGGIWGIAVKLERNSKKLNLDTPLSRLVGKLIMFTRPARYAFKGLIKLLASFRKKSVKENE